MNNNLTLTEKFKFNYYICSLSHQAIERSTSTTTPIVSYRFTFTTISLFLLYKTTFHGHQSICTYTNTQPTPKIIAIVSCLNSVTFRQIIRSIFILFSCLSILVSCFLHLLFFYSTSVTVFEIRIFTIPYTPSPP